MYWGEASVAKFCFWSNPGSENAKWVRHALAVVHAELRSTVNGALAVVSSTPQLSGNVGGGEGGGGEGGGGEGGGSGGGNGTGSRSSSSSASSSFLSSDNN